MSISLFPLIVFAHLGFLADANSSRYFINDVDVVCGPRSAPKCSWYADFRILHPPLPLTFFLMFQGTYQRRFRLDWKRLGTASRISTLREAGRSREMGMRHVK